MGGAFVAVADDASAVYWNPAGIATGATFDLQVSKGRDSSLFVGAALPVLGASYYRTREVTGLPTVSGSPDRQNGGSGEVQVRTLTTTNFGVTVVQTIVPGLVIGTTARVVRGGLEGVRCPTRRSISMPGPWCRPGTCGLGLTARNLREPEFQARRGHGADDPAVQSGCGARAKSAADGRARAVFARDRRRSDDDARCPGRIGERRRRAGSTGCEGARRRARRACAGAPWATRGERFPAGSR